MNVYLYYRTYPGFSEKILFAADKYELVKVCLESMELDKNNVHLCAIVNQSTPEFTNFLSARFPSIYHVSEPCDRDDYRNHKMIFGGIGSYFKTYDMIMENNHHDEDVILIIEDDYLFIAGGLNEWIEASRKFDGFVSPYDAPGKYSTANTSSSKTTLYFHANRHWRLTESSTSTIGGRYKYFKKAFPMIKIPRLRKGRFHVGYFFGKELPSIDQIFYIRCRRWLGIDLVCPVPAIATHLSKNELSPAFDWEKRYLEILSKIKKS